MFKALALISSSYLAVAGPAPKGSKICISNMAGFVMHWHTNDLVTGESSPETDHYPIDKIKCQDITEIPNVEEGDLVMAHVKAVAGVDHDVDHAVIYDASAGTISFSCTGATLTYSCKMNGQDMVETPVAAAECKATPRTMDYWCVDAGAPCVAGFKVTDHVCANPAQECCEHYCMGENCDDNTNEFLQ